MIQSIISDWKYYMLIDDEFGKVLGYDNEAGEIGAIIVEYRKRGLNVEANLCKYLLDINNTGGTLAERLAEYTIPGVETDHPFDKLWATVDQTKILKYAVFI